MIEDVEQIEQKRGSNGGLDAVYLLSPEPYVVDCLLDDIERQNYRRTFLVWTSCQCQSFLRCILLTLSAVLAGELRQKIDSAPKAREQIALFRTLNIDFFPRESHLITFRDPWSFPTLFHPACDTLVKGHMSQLTQKVR